jgi:hypothetical protein
MNWIFCRPLLEKENSSWRPTKKKKIIFPILILVIISQGVRIRRISTNPDPQTHFKKTLVFGQKVLSIELRTYETYSAGEQN